MEKGKDPKKLNAEELEKRVAPASLTYNDPSASDVPADGSGPGTVSDKPGQGPKK